MRLEDLTPALMRQALEVYLAEAWPPGETGTPRRDSLRLLDAKTLGDALGFMERGDPGDDPDSRRFTLRIGNGRYPFMKFVLQEHLVAGEFFFSVDTHDNLDIRPDSPDFRGWEELKAWNRALKLRIEQAWARTGLPTHQDLLRLCGELAAAERDDTQRERLLLVDDELQVAEGLAVLLRARGYAVELAHDGREALERLARDPLPDLVLLDYEMPELDGEEVLRRLRLDPRLERLPVLMATASSIDLARVQSVSGLLRKPYPRHVLFEMIARLLGARRAAR